MSANDNLSVQSALRFFQIDVSQKYDHAKNLASLSRYTVVKTAENKPPVGVGSVYSLLQPKAPMPTLQPTAQTMTPKNTLASSGWLASGNAPGEAGKSAKLPGTPGHAATNVIDRNGGLDPTGRTVDGNNAAGISKQQGQLG